MKKIAFLLLFPAILLSCRDGNNNTEVQTAPRVINPMGGADRSRIDDETTNQEEDRNFLVPMIPIPQEEKLVLTNDLNLDFDTEDEQIILTRLTSEEQDRMILYVVDYNNEDMIFYEALKTPISADSSEGLNVLLQDVTGNSMNEIIVTGFTKEQNHTFDAYTIVTTAAGKLQLANILSLNINGIIEIENFERSQDYRMGQNTNESFTIITEETDEVSEDNLDLIKTTYKWNRSRRIYAPASIDKVPGLSIKEEQLTKIYRSSLEEFVAYISGPWYKVEDLNRNRQPLLKQIIHFDMSGNQIIFAEDNIQEIYDWNDTFRTIFKGINIQSGSSLITSQRRDIYLSLEEVDLIKLNIHGSTEWDGFYSPVTPALQQSLMVRQGIEESRELSRLSGQYRNNKGEDLNIELPYFTLKSGNELLFNGFMEFFILNDISILEMHYLKNNGLIDHRDVYSVEYQESEDSSRIIRTMTLTPGTLTTKGFTRIPGDTIHYEQIEINGN